jgi:hypothetical protein
VSSVAASFARQSAVSFPWIPVFAFTQFKRSKKTFLTRQCRRQTQTQKLEAVCTVRDSWWWALDARNM